MAESAHSVAFRKLKCCYGMCMKPTLAEVRNAALKHHKDSGLVPLDRVCKQLFITHLMGIRQFQIGLQIFIHQYWFQHKFQFFPDLRREYFSTL